MEDRLTLEEIVEILAAMYAPMYSTDTDAREHMKDVLTLAWKLGAFTARMKPEGPVPCTR